MHKQGRNVQFSWLIKEESQLKIQKMEEGISRISERKRVGILDVMILTFSQKISELRTL